MKKRSRKTGKALAAILAALILSVGIGDFLKTVSQNPQKAIETAAGIIRKGDAASCRKGTGSAACSAELLMMGRMQNIRRPFYWTG